MIKEFEPISEGILYLIKEYEPRLQGLSEDIISRKRNSQGRNIRQIVGHMVVDFLRHLKLHLGEINEIITTS